MLPKSESYALDSNRLTRPMSDASCSTASIWKERISTTNYQIVRAGTFDLNVDWRVL